MNLKTTITGLITFIFNLVATYGIEIDVKLQVLITSVLLSVIVYFAQGAESGGEDEQ